MNNKPKPPSSNNRELIRYATMGSQILALLAISVFAGLKADQWLGSSPLLSVTLPLASLVSLFIKIYRDTSRKKNE